MTYKEWAEKNGFSYEESYYDDELEFIVMEKQNTKANNLIISVECCRNGEERICFTNTEYDECENTVFEVAASVNKNILKELTGLTLE